ncbi:hypothetical protein LOZ58_002990 [Ophidiomyces ophidiicola]|nr:hypothetical protein LOZ58_002990 [Ophidiomyces ophidiicola]
MENKLKPRSTAASNSIKAFSKETARWTGQKYAKQQGNFFPYLRRHSQTIFKKSRVGSVAKGAGLDVASILALNVRTEIAYGMFNDGCTAFSWKSDKKSFLAQNWDWDNEQASNLISIHIRPLTSSKPAIHMITEGGIIGKIGLNSKGVGVTLNAVKCAGVDFKKTPCHLALRAALDSNSHTEAIEKIERLGVASACHIMIADSTGSVGLECSSNDIVRLHMGDEGEPRPGVTTHSNHFVQKHLNAVSKILFPDSVPRLDRIRELIGRSTSDPGFDTIDGILKDEKGYPGAICRAPTEKSRTETLFAIVMDLTEEKATVKVGRPTKPTGAFELHP